MIFQLLTVRRIHVFRNHLKLLVGFEINEDCRPLQQRTDLLWVENVKEHNIVPAKMKRFDGSYDRLGIFIKVRNNNYDSPSMDEIPKMSHRPIKIRSCAR